MFKEKFEVGLVVKAYNFACSGSIYTMNYVHLAKL